MTGTYATVSNYPGTSVEISKGMARFGTKRLGIIDSPGVNSLVPMSEDEKVTRDILLNEDIAAALQVMDSKNLRRSLLITLQLLEMGLPMTLALNMYDEAGERGITIDIGRPLEAPRPQGHPDDRDAEVEPRQAGSRLLQPRGACLLRRIDTRTP